MTAPEKFQRDMNGGPTDAELKEGRDAYLKRWEGAMALAFLLFIAWECWQLAAISPIT